MLITRTHVYYRSEPSGKEWDFAFENGTFHVPRAGELVLLRDGRSGTPMLEGRVLNVAHELDYYGPMAVTMRIYVLVSEEQGER